MSILYLDFETRSEVDLKKCGIERYATDSSTKILCACYWFDGQLYRNKFEFLKKLLNSPRVTVSAWNVSFEWRIAKHVLGVDIPAERLICTAALARSYNLPASLGACGAALNLSQQKDDEGKNLMLRVSKPLPKNQRKNGMYHKMTWVDWKRLIRYCEDDVLAEMAIARHLRPLPESEQKLFVRDLKMNYEVGIKIDTDLCTASKELFERTKDKLNAECNRKYGFSATQVAEIKKYTGLPDTTANTIESALEGTLTPEVRRLLEIRQIVSNTTPSKYTAALNMMVNGKVYGTMMFNGAAQTGRWAGRGLQVQNFSRGSFDEDWVDEEMELSVKYLKAGRADELPWTKGNVVDLLKSTARGMIDGPIAVCDYSAIEARVLAWLAEEHGTLDAFREGLDLYKVAASGIYNMDYDQINKSMRAVGKVAVLALGFQGGVGAFTSMAETCGVEVKTDEAKEIVKNWRKANPNVVRYWYECEEMAMQAIADKTRVGSFEYDGEFLHSYLPSGRAIRYFKPEIRKDEKFNKNAITFVTQPSATDKILSKWKVAGGTLARVFTYAGKLAQGKTQATARDLIATAMLKTPEDSVCMTVHDELCSQSHELKVLEEAMLDAPLWAAGLPIAVDGFTAGRYRK